MTPAVTWGDPRIPANFWLTVTPEPNAGCWLREGDSEKVRLGRRLAYRRLIGVVPQGHRVLSTCGGSCVNPTHSTVTETLPFGERHNNRDRLKPSERIFVYMWTKYRIRKNEYERMLAEQNNRCAICAFEFGGFGEAQVTRPHVDHCHATRLVRGLLCNSCNAGIGHLGENPEILERAIAYLAERNVTPKRLVNR